MEAVRLNESPELASAIRDAIVSTPDFDGAEFIRTLVAQGIAQAWLLDRASVAVTEVRGDILYVHAYQGRKLSQFVDTFGKVAKRNGCTRAQFHTLNPGIARLANARAVGRNIYECAL